MFRALCAHHQGFQIALYSIWYHHTETSEWSKITKIQLYKYEHIVVKFMYEFFGCDYCTLLTINMLCFDMLCYTEMHGQQNIKIWRLSAGFLFTLLEWRDRQHSNCLECRELLVQFPSSTYDRPSVPLSLCPS